MDPMEVGQRNIDMINSVLNIDTSSISNYGYESSQEVLEAKRDFRRNLRLKKMDKYFQSSRKKLSFKSQKESTRQPLDQPSGIKSPNQSNEILELKE